MEKKNAFLTSSELISDRHAAAGGKPWGRSKGGNLVAEHEKKMWNKHDNEEE